MKSLSGRLGIFLIALSFVVLTGCANTLSDLVRSKQQGKGTSKIYRVNVDQAWEIAKRILEWEGTGDIKENRPEGFMTIRSGSTLLYKITMIGVWIEPIDKVQSKVTVIAKSKTSFDTMRGLSEADFHQSFLLFAQEPEMKQR